MSRSTELVRLAGRTLAVLALGMGTLAVAHIVPFVDAVPADGRSRVAAAREAASRIREPVASSASSGPASFVLDGNTYMQELISTCDCQGTLEGLVPPADSGRRPRLLRAGSDGRASAVAWTEQAQGAAAVPDARMPSPGTSFHIGMGNCQQADGCGTVAHYWMADVAGGDTGPRSPVPLVQGARRQLDLVSGTWTIAVDEVTQPSLAINLLADELTRAGWWSPDEGMQLSSDWGARVRSFQRDDSFCMVMPQVEPGEASILTICRMSEGHVPPT